MPDPDTVVGTGDSLVTMGPTGWAAARAGRTRRGRLSAVRVLVVDDHRMFAESLVRLFSDEDDLDVVGVAASAREALELTTELQPDVVVLDYKLPDLDGAATVEVLRNASKNTEIVMLTGYADDSALATALQAGCSGFVTKDKAAEELLNTVRAVATGRAAIPTELLKSMVPRIAGARTPLVGADLTAREREVLELLAFGLSTDAICDQLCVSRNTVRNHTQNVIRKLGAHSKLEAVAIATRAGLVSRES